MFIDNPYILVLPVTDLKRAEIFYDQVLGLKVFESEEMPGYAFAETDEGVEMLFYVKKDAASDNTLATFIVEDILAEIQELRDKGVVFEKYKTQEVNTDENGIAMIGTTRMAWFKDTEGNILSLVQFDDTEVDQDSLA